MRVFLVAVLVSLANATALQCPEGCKSYYDGCNMCRCDEETRNAMCTRKFCLEKEEAKCMDGLKPEESEDSADYNCMTKEVWSAQKIMYCCKEEGLGCNMMKSGMGSAMSGMGSGKGSMMMSGMGSGKGSMMMSGMGSGMGSMMMSGMGSGMGSMMGSGDKVMEYCGEQIMTCVIESYMGGSGMDWQSGMWQSGMGSGKGSMMSGMGSGKGSMGSGSGRDSSSEDGFECGDIMEDVDGIEKSCGQCSVIVEKKEFPTCNDFCDNFGLECLKAEEDGDNDSCTPEDNDFTCSEITSDTGDYICTCKEGRRRRLQATNSPSPKPTPESQQEVEQDVEDEMMMSGMSGMMSGMSGGGSGSGEECSWKNDKDSCESVMDCCEREGKSVQCVEGYGCKYFDVGSGMSGMMSGMSGMWGSGWGSGKWGSGMGGSGMGSGSGMETVEIMTCVIEKLLEKPDEMCQKELFKGEDGQDTGMGRNCLEEFRDCADVVFRKGNEDDGECLMNAVKGNGDEKCLMAMADGADNEVDKLGMLAQYYCMDYQESCMEEANVDDIDRMSEEQEDALVKCVNDAAEEDENERCTRSLRGMQDAKKCPEEPQNRGECENVGLTCNYGRACCCGKCNAEMVSQCTERGWMGRYTDACMGGCGVCPKEQPKFGDKCDPKANNEMCKYGEECCCGKCYPSVFMECTADGEWQGGMTDACENKQVCPGKCSEGCRSWFDGCNTCGCGEDNKITFCTQKFCAEKQQPKCLDEEFVVTTQAFKKMKDCRKANVERLKGEEKHTYKMGCNVYEGGAVEFTCADDGKSLNYADYEDSENCSGDVSGKGTVTPEACDKDEEDGLVYRAMFKLPQSCIPDEKFWKDKFDGSFLMFTEKCRESKEMCSKCSGKFKKGKCALKADKVKCNKVHPTICAALEGCQTGRKGCKGKAKFD